MILPHVKYSRGLAPYKVQVIWPQPLVIWGCRILQRAQSAKGKAAEKSPQEEQPPAAPASSGDAATIDQQITDQGNKIRRLKGEKAAKV